MFGERWCSLSFYGNITPTQSDGNLGIFSSWNLHPDPSATKIVIIFPKNRSEHTFQTLQTTLPEMKQTPLKTTKHRKWMHLDVGKSWKILRSVGLKPQGPILSGGPLETHSLTLQRCHHLRSVGIPSIRRFWLEKKTWNQSPSTGDEFGWLLFRNFWEKKTSQGWIYYSRCNHVDICTGMSCRYLGSLD